MRAFAALVFVLSIALTHAVAAGTLAQPTTTVILVRHAEKNAHPPGGDAGLTTKGIVRSQTLARTLRDSGIAAVFASRYGRARLTAEPIAAALGDSVRIYDPNDLPALAHRIQDEFAGRIVLVVGHGDTISPTLTELGGPALAKDESVDYDRMFVLTLSPGAEPRLLRMVYGDPTR